MKPLPPNQLHNYRARVQWIESFSGLKRAGAYGFDAHPKEARKRLEHFLSLLGSPHKGLNVVHVTGTSGKGSTVMMVGAMLRLSGKRTGIYCSPHTTTTIERFYGPDGLLMSIKDFIAITDQLQPAIAQMDNDPLGTPSYLEMMVAIAFLYFKKMRCQWVVLEVGMGGARDATNVIPPPAVAAITPIDLDHAHLIGTTLSDIAREKSAIIKRNTHVFTTERRATLRAIIEQRCNAVGAYWHPQLNFLPNTVIPSMSGSHQHTNAQLAASIGMYLKLPVVAIEKGIRQTRLPCRFETMRTNPTVILDGGHNALAVRVVSKKLREIPPARLILVFALSESKDAKTILKNLPPAKLLVFTRFLSSRSSQSPGALKRTMLALRRGRDYDRILSDLDPNHALMSALEYASERDTVAIFGSLYLTGSLRAHWVSEENILKNRSSFPKN